MSEMNQKDLVLSINEYVEQVRLKYWKELELAYYFYFSNFE